VSFFDRGAFEALGIREGYAGAEYGTIRILGGTWRVQFETVDLNLAVDPDISWTARAAFVLIAGLQMPFQGVLGTAGFLDKYAVTFNAYYNYFVVERPDDFHDRVGHHLVADPAKQADESWRRGRP